MKTILTAGNQMSARPAIGHAAILAAPLWASGLVFLALLFAITRHGEFFSLQFLAMSVAVVLASTMAALRVMDRDLRHASARLSHGHLRMKMRARRLHGARLI